MLICVAAFPPFAIAGTLFVTVLFVSHLKCFHAIYVVVNVTITFSCQENSFLGTYTRSRSGFEMS